MSSHTDPKLKSLYRDVILDHNKHPRNFRKIDDYTFCREGFNPICGDKLFVYIKTDENQMITDISFEGEGCAISMASASIMTETLKNKPIKEADKFFSRFHNMLLKKPSEHINEEENLGKLKVFAGISQFPSRIKCASLCWHTMNAALDDSSEPASTE